MLYLATRQYLLAKKCQLQAILNITATWNVLYGNFMTTLVWEFHGKKHVTYDLRIKIFANCQNKDTGLWTRIAVL